MKKIVILPFCSVKTTLLLYKYNVDLLCNLNETTVSQIL